MSPRYFFVAPWVVLQDFVARIVLAQYQDVIRLGVDLLVALLPHAKFADVVTLKSANLATLESVEREVSGNAFHVVHFFKASARPRS